MLSLGEGQNGICIVSENEGKIRELNATLRGYGIKLRKCAAKKIEIQSDSIEEIAKFAALQAYSEIKAPLIVDDSALLIEALNGFPGPYSSYVYERLGLRGIIKLMEDIKNRRACFVTALAYIDAHGMEVFEGRVCGEITSRPRGSGGFGYDPIFMPEGSAKTFAEMDIVEKNSYSHRGKAARSFAEWFSRR